MAEQAPQAPGPAPFIKGPKHGDFQRSISTTSTVVKTLPIGKAYFGVHKWTINDFETGFLLLAADDFFKTTFSVRMEEEDEARFHLELGHSLEDPLSLSLFAYTDDDQIDFGAFASLFSFSQKELASTSRMKWRFVKGERVGYKNWYKLSDLQFPTDSLTIYWYFDVQYLGSCFAIEEKIDRPTFQIRRDDLENISDFTIHCGEKSFPVHKIALANSSKVFCAMFSNRDLDKNKSNETTIKNFKPETVDMMIEVMYSHHLREDLLPSDLENLLEAANVYGIEFLNYKCEQRLLARFMDINYCTQLLCVGLMYNCKTLATSARQMVLKNISKVCQTKQFTELMTVFPGALENTAGQ